MAAPRPSATPFGRYTLLHRLAVGGMAEVFLAELAIAAGVRKQVVIKKILKRLAVDESFVEMFIGEARIAAGLSHGNIAQLFDFGDVDGEYYLALEYVRGESVSRLFARAQQKLMHPPVEYACFLALEMCKGLHYAHTRLDEQHRPLGIVHRDISPQNVLVSYEGEVKIVDFGIAKAYGEEGRNHTAAGVVKGKYLYFSPEQARARKLDASTDVYATGVVLYEMLCAQLPYEGEMVEVLRRIVRGDFLRPSAHNPAVTPELDSIVLKAMAKTPAERYPTALAFQEALSGYLSANAPRFTQSNLANLIRLLFRDELVAAGETANTPEEFRRQAASWPKPPERSNPRLSVDTRAARPKSNPVPNPGDTRAPTSPLALGDPDAEVTVRGGMAPIALGIGLLGLVAAAGITIGIAHLSAPSEQFQPTKVVAPVAVAPVAPVAAKPVVEPAKPARVKAESLPDRLKLLPKAAGAAHGGRQVNSLACQDPPARAEVRDVAQQAEEAAVNSHKEAIALLERALAAEPTAGQLYLRVATEADGLADLEPKEPLMLALETYALNCPSNPIVGSVLQRASGTPLVGATGDSSAHGHRDPLPPSASAKDLLARFEEDLHLGVLDAAQDDLDRAHALKAEVRKQQKRLNTARAVVDAAQARRDEVEYAGKSVSDLIALGTKASDAKDYNLAIRIERVGLKHDPRNPELHRDIANALALVGRLDDAASEYRMYVKLAPNDPKADSIRGLLVNWDAMRKMK